MKRMLLLLAAAIAVSLSAVSEVLSPEDALNRVMSTQTGRHLAKSASNVKLKRTYSVESKPALYVFSRGSEAGYLVLSADTETDAVLGYCDSGTFDADNMPPAMNYWLEQYADQIAYLRSYSLLNLDKIKSTVHADIPPLCKTNWNQTSPYNDDCPYYKTFDSKLGRCVTGCAATAYAQVLKYHNWPNANALAYNNDYDVYTYRWKDLGLGHTGVYTYDSTNKTSTRMAALSFAFKNHVFDWNNMKDNYDTYTAKQGAAVADLMYACGVLYDMDYGQESGAQSSSIIKTYKYMHLDDEITIVKRNYYDRQEWEDMIYDALSVGPIMYGGQGSSGGHEFVCDGYQNGYFHINWGWGGTSNGYFLLDTLDYTSDGSTPTATGFNYDQDAILYIQPERSTASPRHYNVLCDNFTISESSQSLGNTINVLSRTYFYSTLPMAGQLMLKVTSTDGKKTVYLDGGTFSENSFGSVIPGGNYSLPRSLSDGTYTITPAFMADNIKYDVRCNHLSNRAYLMTVKSGKCTFSPLNNPQLTITDFSINSDLSTETAFNATAILNNSSNYEYSNYVTVAIIDNTGNFVACGNAVQISVPANGQYSLNYLSCINGYSLTLGQQYKLVLAEAELKSYYSCSPKKIISNAITLTAVEKIEPTMFASNPVVNDTNTDVDRENIVIKTNITTNHYFADQIYAFIYDTNGTIINILQSDPIVINKTTSELTIKGSLPELSFGSTYIVYIGEISNFGLLYTDNSKTSIATQRFIVSNDPLLDVKTAVDSINADTDAINTELYTLQGVRVNADNASPGIYIKRTRLANGQTHSSRIYLK